MKALLSMMMAATILIAPMAQAQDTRSHGNDAHRTVGRTVTIEKKTVVKKQRWNKGHRLSRAERDRLTQVRDYSRYRLQTPPRGYQWFRVDNEFLLIGAATGVIASIIAAR